jgi:hypothetical protein
MIAVVGGPCDGQQVRPIPEPGTADRRPLALCWICRPVPPGQPWPGPYFPYHFDNGRYVWKGPVARPQQTPTVVPIRGTA